MVLINHKYFFLSICSIFLLLGNINSFAQQLYFKKLTAVNGLSNNTVNDIIQDSIGFIWIATEDGLNRFDGYDFKVYRHSTSEENSLEDNSVKALCNDKKGKIWIGTKSGWLNCYDPVEEKFSKWRLESELIHENSITTIFEDSRSMLWIGTYRSGLYRLDQLSGKIENWKSIAADSTTLTNNYISSITEDSYGNLWIGTYYGFNRFNPDNIQEDFERFLRNSEQSNKSRDNVIWEINRSNFDPEILWIGTANGLLKFNVSKKTYVEYEILNPDSLQFGNAAGTVIEEITRGEEFLWISSYAGLVRLNIASGETIRFLTVKSDPTSLSSNQIHQMMVDRSGVFWFATDNGLSYFSFKSTRFNNILSQVYRFTNSELISNKNVNAIIKTSDERLWFGTSEGLYCTVNKNGKAEFNKINGSEKLNIWSLAAGKSNELWVGTYGSGLYHFDLITNKLEFIPLFKNGLYPESIKFIKTILCDQNNNLWIGYWGYGLARFSYKSGELNQWLKKPETSNSLSHNDVWTIYQDEKNRLWIGTNGGGLNLYDYINDKYYLWIADENLPNSLSGNSIYSICEAKFLSDQNGHKNSFNKNNTVLWIGTNNGLNRFEIIETNQNILSSLTTRITNYSIKDGLSDNFIKSIAEDDNGNLWLGTNSGISFLNVYTNKIINFTTSDGIKGTVFNFSSALKDNNSLIYFGTNEGINFFKPEDIKLSYYAPQIVITDFQIFNQSISAGTNSVLKKSIHSTREIRLSHSQDVFSIRFAALDLSFPNDIKYAYKMVGFDKDWVHVQNRRLATYTNLNPGEYIFYVKSTNSDGIWSDNEASLKITITPPWWQTLWAIGLYILIFILGLWGIIRFQINRAKLQHELKMREFESHHLREIEGMKSRFFANLSHEFRTPLTLIKGPLEQLLNGKAKGNQTELYKMALRNTEKLQNLIDELLELSKLEIESIPLNREKHNVVLIIQAIASNFNPLAEQKNISLKFVSEIETLIINLDRDKLEKIINNLLSNAFKFTHSGGNVNIELLVERENNDSFAKILVVDNGVGIPEQHQSKIFDRFYQVEENINKKLTGSGIGLALVKELVALHNWSIELISIPEKGSTFTIKIPLSEEEANSIKYISDEFIAEDEEQDTLNDFIEEEFSTKIENHKDGKPVVLLVEDSEDVRTYITYLLENEYNLLVAENARNGLDLAVQNIPDLILSDVMMPEVDGIEFCNLIKTNKQTSHIPVILLTARVTEESRIQGLESGADDYMTKPFNYDELAIRIKNLIEQRKSLKIKFSKEINFQPVELVKNALDKQFMIKLSEHINKNIGNPNYDTDHLANDLYISRRQLHRKLIALTGHSPGEFMRTMKMKYAAKMLIENKFSVTQIAYEVGFGSPAQFTRAFKKHFNSLPSEFSQNFQDRTKKKSS